MIRRSKKKELQPIEYNESLAEHLVYLYDEAIDEQSRVYTSDPNDYDPEQSYQDQETYEEEAAICDVFSAVFHVDIGLGMVAFLVARKRDYLRSVQFVKNYDKYMHKYNRIISGAAKIGLKISTPSLEKPALIVLDMVSELMAIGAIEADAVASVSALLGADIETAHKDWHNQVRPESVEKKKAMAAAAKKRIEEDLRWCGKIK